MGKGAQGEVRDREQQFMWEEIRKHRKPDDTWVVLEGKVYDVTNFKKRHPGGWQLMEDHAGQDATIPFQLYHMDMKKVRKFMKPLQIGVLGEETWSNERDRKLDEDFYKLWEKCKEMGLFKPSVFVHFLLLAQIVFYEAVAYWIISSYGTGWIPFLAAAFFVGASWTHAGYSMHDYSHRAVTHNAKIDYMIQLALFSFQSGFSSNFWTEYHSRHHSKPNLYEKDPTININEQFFVIGHTQAGRRAKTDAKQETKSFSFNLQHNYWFLLGPPLYIPVRFQIASVLYAWRRNFKVDLVLMAGCALRFMYFYLPHMNIFNLLLFLWIARQVMSHWFVWISLSNHLALHPEDDSYEGMTWFEAQVKGTINLPFGYFYEWYSGTLNLQIEHHLFPYMPRENFRKIVPMVKEICRKHDIEYKETKTMFEAFYMVWDMLRQSGSTWHHEYYKALAGM